MRIGLAVGAVVCIVLACGLGLTGAGYPYRLLFDYAPGWDGVRVPGRVFTLGTLFIALLAGAGAQLAAGRLGGLLARFGRVEDEGDGGVGDRGAVNSGEAVDRSGARPRRLSAASLSAFVGVVLAAGIVGEGAGHLGHPVVPQPARAEIGLPGPLLDLPTDGTLDRISQYFSTNGFYKIPVGNSTFDIPSVDDLRGGMHGFPDKASVEKLRYYGIRTVVLHLVTPRELPAPARAGPGRAAERRRSRRQAGRRARRHPPARRLARDLRDRPRPEGPARVRLRRSSR